MTEKPLTKDLEHVLTWAQDYRIAWIEEISSIYNYINREHICRKFRISEQQASTDLRVHNLVYGTLKYNRVAKRYERED